MCHFLGDLHLKVNFLNIQKHFQIIFHLQMLEIMKFYGKKVQLASMRGNSWHVVEFSWGKGLYANSLSGPFKINQSINNSFLIITHYLNLLFFFRWTKMKPILSMLGTVSHCQRLFCPEKTKKARQKHVEKKGHSGFKIVMSFSETEDSSQVKLPLEMTEVEQAYF